MPSDATSTPQRFAPQHPLDRNFFLLILLLIWTGIVMGFGLDMARHIKAEGFDYPLIVHVHAAAFVGWMVLLSAQILLIRANAYALHKTLGIAGACLAAVMMVLGPMTQILVSRAHAASPNADPAFIIVAFIGMLIFGVLVTAALALRQYSPAHKRLMLLATIAISNAGFARWLGEPIAKWLGDGQFTLWAILYLATTGLVVLIGLYDLMTRGRLLAAYVAGAVISIGPQALSVWLYFQPAWLEVAKRILAA